MSRLLIVAWPLASQGTADTEYWATRKTELLLFNANFFLHISLCIMAGVSDLISRKCLKWKGMPEPAREQRDKLPSDYFWTAVRFLSAQFLPLFNMRGSMNINHCFYHLLWKGSLCVWMAWKPQTCFSLCGITMSRKHFSQKERGGGCLNMKKRLCGRETGLLRQIICPFRVV